MQKVENAAFLGPPHECYWCVGNEFLKLSKAFAWFARRTFHGSIKRASLHWVITLIENRQCKLSKMTKKKNASKSHSCFSLSLLVNKIRYVCGNYAEHYQTIVGDESGRILSFIFSIMFSCTECGSVFTL